MNKATLHILELLSPKPNEGKLKPEHYYQYLIKKYLI